MPPWCMLAGSPWCGLAVHRWCTFGRLLTPEAWYQGNCARMGEEAWQDYQRAIHDPATVHAMCEDYRAGLGIDRAHDDDDRRAGRRLACPTLVLWASQDDMEDLYGDVLDIWRP